MKRSFWSVTILSVLLLACGCATHTTSYPAAPAASSSTAPSTAEGSAIYTPAVALPPPSDQTPPAK